MKFKAPKNTPKNRTRNKMPMYNQQPVIYSVKQPSRAMGCLKLLVFLIVLWGSIWASIILYDDKILDDVYTIRKLLQTYSVAEVWEIINQQQ